MSRQHLLNILVILGDLKDDEELKTMVEESLDAMKKSADDYSLEILTEAEANPAYAEELAMNLILPH